MNHMRSDEQFDLLPIAGKVLVMTTFKSVVYRRGMREHLLIDGQALTLCRRQPEHINPGVVDPLPNERIVAGNYCVVCVNTARKIVATEQG